MAKSANKNNDSAANLGFEAKLWLAADKLRNNMVALERDNPRLKGVLPKDYARPALDKHRLGELIDLIGTIALLPAWRSNPPQSPFAKGGSTEVAHLAQVENAEVPPFAKGGLGGICFEGIYQDTPGFCKSATTAEIAAHGYVLTPGRYVGAEEIEDDGEPFEEKMTRLVAELNEQFDESAKLEQAIKVNIGGLGYGL